VRIARGEDNPKDIALRVLRETSNEFELERAAQTLSAYTGRRID
jgi:hypothetical protein